MPEGVRMSRVCWTGAGYPLGAGLATVFTGNKGIKTRHFVKCGVCWLDIRPYTGDDGGQIRLHSVSLAAFCDQAALNSLVIHTENSSHGR